MKSLFPKGFMLLAACILAACSTVTVTTDYDTSVSFANYKTYRLAPAPRGQTLSAIAEVELRASLRRELGLRGIAERSTGRADLAVVRHVFVDEKVSVNQYTDWGYGFAGGWPYGHGHYGMWTGAPRTFTNVDRYMVGTLVLDFVDTRTQRLVFRGVGKAVLTGPESNARKIEEAVTKIIAGFPAGTPR